MIKFVTLVTIPILAFSCNTKKEAIKIFDVHVHGGTAPEKQVSNLKSTAVKPIRFLKPY